MLAGFTTALPTPVTKDGGFGTVGAVFASATVNVLDCAVAPKPSFTVTRKYSVALATVKSGATNVAVRVFPFVIDTVFSAHDGAQGTPLESVWIHEYV